MIKGKKVLSIIPARGGSKGLPGKNIRSLLGRPLIHWTIERSLACTYIDRTFVSTEAPEIADVSRKAGADIPFHRPAILATDSASSIDVILNVVDELKARYDEDYDLLLMLEPTSPLRKPDDLSRAIEQFVNSPLQPTALVSGGELHTEHPLWTKRLDEKQFVRPYIEVEGNFYQRQLLPKAYFPYGVVYLSTVDSMRKERTFYQERTLLFEIERWQNYEIDDFLDFLCVEAVMQSQRKGTV